MVKAITLTQPWATLVAIGEKRIETRSWGTSYRGPLAIHAAKGLVSVGGHSGLIDLCLDEPFASVLARGGAGLLVPGHDLPLGAVIATCRLVDCLPIAAAPNGLACVAPGEEGLMRAWSGPQMFGERAKLQVGDMTTEHEAAFGDYTPGRFGWLLDDIQRLPEPVPARGSLGLWDWEMAA